MQKPKRNQSFCTAPPSSAATALGALEKRPLAPGEGRGQIAAPKPQYPRSYSASRCKLLVSACTSIAWHRRREIQAWDGNLLSLFNQSIIRSPWLDCFFLLPYANSRMDPEKGHGRITPFLFLIASFLYFTLILYLMDLMSCFTLFHFNRLSMAACYPKKN